MVQPRRVNLDEQAKELSCTTIIIADHAVTGIKLADGAVTSASLAPGSVVLSLHADSSPNITDDIQLVSGSNITLSQIGNVITINSTGVGGGANPQLSNLSAVAINTSLLPAVNDAIDLGSLSLVYANTYTRNIQSDLATLIIGSSVSVNGSIAATGFQLSTAPTAGYVLTSDASGNGTWQASTGGTGTFAKDFVTVASPVPDHIITLSHTPAVDSETVIWQGLILTKHGGQDYTIAGNIVTLSANITLTVGDELQVSYSY